MDGLGKPRGAGRIVSVAKARAVHHMQMSFMRRSLHHVYCNIIYYIMQTSAKVLHALQTCQQKTMQSSHEMDQQSYFYVVWPEERAPTVLSPSAAAGPSNGSPKINAAMAKERIPVGTICEGTQDGKHKSVPGEHAAAAKGEDTLHRGPSNLVELGSMAEQAIVHLQRILEATDKHKSTGPSSRQNSLALPCNTASSYTGPTSQAEAQYASISSTLHNGCSYTNGCSTPPPAKRHCNISRSTYATLPTAINADTSDSPFDTASQCLECEVKDAEIQTLRRRIQLLKEQLASATSWSGERSLTPQQQNGTSNQMGVEKTSSINGDKPESTGTPPVVTTPSNQHQSTTNGSVELVTGSGVYISSSRLEETLRDAKTGTQLARKLMDAFWDKSTLARSTLSARSKFQYQQLDRKIITAIEAYCLAYDRSTHSRDIHATMTDKCCQARSRKGANKVPFT